MKLAKERIHFQGLPARICWLGYGERAEFGVAMNELVKRGEIKAPIVIGRDHLDTGSVASPFRETEGMLDGSDAIADWPLLNALINTAAGASWVSIHNGGGVGIGYSQHAGMVVVADGTENSKRRLERVLTSDPGMGSPPPCRRRLLAPIGQDRHSDSSATARLTMSCEADSEWREFIADRGSNSMENDTSIFTIRRQPTRSSINSDIKSNLISRDVVS